MTSRSAIFTLVAAIWVGSVIYLTFVAQYELACELLFYGSLAFWTALAWFGRYARSKRAPSEGLSRQFAPYGVNSLSMSLRTRPKTSDKSLIRMLLTAAAFSASLGAAIGFFIGGQIGTAFAMLIASVAGAMAGASGRVG